jgi:hypothetical protein
MSQTKATRLLKELEDEIELIRINTLPDAKDIVIEKLKNGSIQNGNHFPEHLLKNKEVFKEIILSVYYFSQLTVKNFNFFGLEFILELLDTNFDKTLHYFNYYRGFCINDMRFAKKILSKQPNYISNFPMNEKFILEMMKTNPDIYHHLTYLYRKNRKIIVEYVFLSSVYPSFDSAFLTVKKELLREK